MASDAAEIVIRPYHRIVIHEVIEQRMGDLVESVLSGARAAGGTTIPMLMWCNGIVFQPQPFSPNSESVIKELLEGTIHFGSVTFAMKEKFESEVRSPQGSIRLVDQGINPNFVKMAEILKQRAKFKG